jgi:hypothetical protein
MATVTNGRTGALVLCNLAVGQKAVVSPIGHASLLIGAGAVSNAQCIVVGDGNVSHGARSVTADSFHGGGTGLTGIPVGAIAAAGIGNDQFLRGDGSWALPDPWPFVVSEEGDTSVVYVVTSSGHTNVIGRFYSQP